MNIGDEAVQERRDALQRLAMFPLPLKKPSIEEILNACAAGLTACSYLAIGNHADMHLAASMITTYLPMLQPITVDSSKYQKAAAACVSQALQIKSQVSYHLDGVQQAIAYAQDAVAWAKKSQNKVLLIMAQRELLGAYEWTALQHRPQVLHIATETQYLMELKQGPKVPPMIRSRVYTGVAKYQALNGLKDEMEDSLRKAEEAFFDSSDTENVPAYIIHSLARLKRHKAIAYAYLGKQEKALEVFGEIINLDSKGFDMKSPMAERTYLGVLSEVMFSSLKVPLAKKDKDLSIALWKTVMRKAIDLQSETYYSEANIAFQIMEGIWSDDPEIINLQGFIQHW